MAFVSAAATGILSLGCRTGDFGLLSVMDGVDCSRYLDHKMWCLAGVRKRTDSFWYPSVCVDFRLCKLLLAAAAASYAAAAVGLRFLLLAAAAVSRCRCYFSYLLQL